MSKGIGHVFTRNIEYHVLRVKNLYTFTLPKCFQKNVSMNESTTLNCGFTLDLFQ